MNTHNSHITPELISIKEAQPLVSYSKDYIAKLARERKIIATRVDGQWLINPQSLINFFENSRLEERVRHDRLSAERKQALALKQQQSLQVANRNRQLLSSESLALWQSVLIVMAGLLVGSTVYAFSTGLDNLALAGLGFGGDQSAVAVVASASLTDPSEFEVTSSKSSRLVKTSRSVTPMAADEGALLLPGAVGRQSEEWYLEAAFSDEVSVRMLDNLRGEIYLRDHPEVAPLTFVRVPVVNDDWSYSRNIIEMESVTDSNEGNSFTE